MSPHHRRGRPTRAQRRRPAADAARRELKPIGAPVVIACRRTSTSVPYVTAIPVGTTVRRALLEPGSVRPPPATLATRRRGRHDAAGQGLRVPHRRRDRQQVIAEADVKFDKVGTSSRSVATCTARCAATCSSARRRSWPSPTRAATRRSPTSPKARSNCAPGTPTSSSTSPPARAEVGGSGATTFETTLNFHAAEAARAPQLKPRARRRPPRRPRPSSKDRMPTARSAVLPRLTAHALAA